MLHHPNKVKKVIICAAFNVFLARNWLWQKSLINFANSLGCTLIGIISRHHSIWRPQQPLCGAPARGRVQLLAAITPCPQIRPQPVGLGHLWRGQRVSPWRGGRHPHLLHHAGGRGVDQLTQPPAAAVGSPGLGD